MKPISADLGKFKEDIFLIQSDVKSSYFERAINKLHELMVHYPDKAEPYYEMAQIAYKFWRNDEVEANHLKALKVDPEYFPTYTHYALLLIKEARFDEALQLLEQAKSVQSREDSDIYFYYGLLHQHQGAFEKAIQHYQKALQCSINQSQIELNVQFIDACQKLLG